MKSLFALPLVVVVGLACGPRPTPSRVLPALRVSPEVVDLGNAAVSSTGELKSRVSLKNLGTGPLHIKSVRSSCGCTVVHPPRSELKPGASDEIEIVVKVGVEAGPRASTVTIESTDPSRTSFPIQVRWNAEPRIFLEPAQIDFGPLRPGEATKQSVTLRLASRDNSKVLATSSTPELEVTWEELPDATRKFLVNLRAGSRIGEHKGIITLTGVDSDLATMIPVHWRVKASLRVTPSSLYSGEAVSGEILEGRFLISSEENRPFRIESARIEGGGEQEPLAFEASASPRHELKIRVRAPEKSGVHRMIVKIATDAADGGHVEVPWSMLVH